MSKQTVTKILATAFAGACCMCLTACQEQGPAEQAGERVDEAAESAGEAVEDAGEAIQEGTGGGY
ncbi:MAG: hypothetical protein EA423_00645 [Phycisphaerales bacterium]|nr:MAG: hypothetical protein EA423_00645 [Phycisphaerales bacterium]